MRPDATVAFAWRRIALMKSAGLVRAAPGGPLSSTAIRVQRSGIAARALYVASSALTGAVLYMLATWPAPHASTRPVAVAQAPVAVAPPLQQTAADQTASNNARPTGMVGGIAVLEAVRAVSGASQTLMLAQTGERTTGSTAPLAAQTAGSSVTAAVAPASAVIAPTAARNATFSVAGGSGSAVAAAPTGLAGSSVDTRQPPPGSDGPNRISVPGSPAQPAAAPVSGGVAPPTGGSNRIAVPGAPPSR